MKLGGGVLNKTSLGFRKTSATSYKCHGIPAAYIPLLIKWRKTWRVFSFSEKAVQCFGNKKRTFRWWCGWRWSDTEGHVWECWWSTGEAGTLWSYLHAANQEEVRVCKLWGCKEKQVALPYSVHILRWLLQRVWARLGISLIFRDWVHKIQSRPGKELDQVYLGLFPQLWTNSKRKSRREAVNILTTQKADAH